MNLNNPTKPRLPNLAKSYRSVAVETASPGRVTLMLFDGALKFMQAAKEGFNETIPAQRNEKVHNNIIKVNNILSELQSSLRFDADKKLATTLYELYDFMRRELTKVNLQKDPKSIEAVYKMLTEIRDAWSEMLAKQNEAPVAAVVNALS